MKTLTKTIGGNRPETDPAAIQNRGRKGSTIVAVMAAMVFIGIVVASMLKNTGSQAAVSRGYGAVMDMSSTVQSGFVATEGFFLGDENRGLAFIDTLVKTNGGSQTNKKFVYGKNGKERLATSNQYFSSTAIPGSVQNLINRPDSCLRAGFFVAAGKSGRGKEIRAGRTFLQFKNLQQLQVTSDIGAKNAIYSKRGISNADGGLTVKDGGATFMSYAKFQNSPAIFEQTAYFGGGAYFMKDSARFKDKAYFADTVTRTEFHVKAIFDSVVIFKGPVEFHSSVTFKQGAYFMKGVTFENGTGVFDGTAYFGSSVSFASSSPVTFNQRTYFTNTVQFGTTATFQSSSSAYFGGNATFNSLASFGGPVQFDGKPTFKGNVTFNKDKWAYFNDVVFEKAGSFYSETYFNGSVTLGTDNLNFYHRVGFNGNVTLGGKVIKSNTDASGNKYDVSINGKITDPYLNDSRIEGILQSPPATGSKDHDVYYSSNFGTIYPANWVATTVFKNFKNIKPDGGTTVWSRMGYIKKDSLKTPAPIIPPHPVDSDRHDPQLSISNIYADTSKGVKILNAQQAMTTNNSTFDMAKLRTTYANAIQNPSTLYGGTHLVIEITSNITLTSDVADEKFDANIIYIIKDGGTLNAGGGNFYSNTSDSATTSTLIYVGAGNATLAQFGTKDTFRGFIYIDALNTAQTNSLHFKPNGTSKIIGAVHNFATVSKFEWNGGDKSTPIIFNPKVLNAFASLYPPTDDTVSKDTNVTLKVIGNGIEVRMLGVYYH